MTLSLCTLNANGIRAAEKRGFSDWIGRTKPDILCLQEVRARPEQVDASLISPAGYNSRWVCAEKKGYSGVAICSRAGQERSEVEGYKIGSGLDWGDAEGRVLRADFEKLSVISIYIPSGSSSEERQERKYAYMDHLLEFTKKLARSRRPIALCGDFNIAHTELDIHNPKANKRNSGFLPEEREWFTRWLDQGWRDVVREQHPEEVGLYSWWSARGQARAKDLGWRLDYVLANRALAERATGGWIDKEAGLSDHAPVWAEFDL